jgi:hypothetical protein
MRSFWNVQTEVIQIHEFGTKSLEIVCFMGFYPVGCDCLAMSQSPALSKSQQGFKNRVNSGFSRLFVPGS